LSLRFQADADLRYIIVKAVRHREPSIDFASAADSSLAGIGDPELLERAAQERRILVSHDRRTMLAYFAHGWRRKNRVPAYLWFRRASHFNWSSMQLS
jgi:Domain of unknown function (DUF5615)